MYSASSAFLYSSYAIGSNITPGITRRPEPLKVDEIMRVGGRVHAVVRRGPTNYLLYDPIRSRRIPLRHAINHSRPGEINRHVLPRHIVFVPRQFNDDEQDIAQDSSGVHVHPRMPRIEVGIEPSRVISHRN